MKTLPLPIFILVFGLLSLGAAQGIPKNTVHFADLKGGLPAGCARDFVPFGDSSMGYATDHNTLSLYLSELSVDQEGEKYTFTVGIRGVGYPRAGDVIALDQVLFKSAVEYNCNLTQPLSAWVVRDGQIRIVSINTNTGMVSFTLTARMIPGQFNDSDATFTIQFDGTVRFVSGPSQP